MMSAQQPEVDTTDRPTYRSNPLLPVCWSGQQQKLTSHLDANKLPQVCVATVACDALVDARIGFASPLNVQISARANQLLAATCRVGFVGAKVCCCGRQKERKGERLVNFGRLSTKQDKSH